MISGFYSFLASKKLPGEERFSVDCSGSQSVIPNSCSTPRELVTNVLTNSQAPPQILNWQLRRWDQQSVCQSPPGNSDAFWCLTTTQVCQEPPSCSVQTESLRRLIKMQVPRSHPCRSRLITWSGLGPGSLSCFLFVLLNYN